MSDCYFMLCRYRSVCYCNSATYHDTSLVVVAIFATMHVYICVYLYIMYVPFYYNNQGLECDTFDNPPDFFLDGRPGIVKPRK